MTEMLLERAFLQAVTWFNRKAKSLAMRLTYWTGKSRTPIHPKHLAAEGDDELWYLRRVAPGQRVLDIGSGNGIACLRVAPQVGAQGGYVVGLEGDPRNLVAAQILRRQRNVANVDFVRVDLEDLLPIAKGEFDRVLFMDVIEHLHRRVEVLAAIHALLKPDGLLLVSAPNVDTTWKRRLSAAGLCAYIDPDHKIEYTWQSLIEELAAGGFEPVGAPELTVYDTPWAGTIDAIGGISLPVYRMLSEWKVAAVHRHPHETTGWRVVCRKIPPAQAGAE
jgi:2-polyprenyl-3-methyl-5-hydroxy-6-metoxy-1,4-benzoquinol methylase